MSNTFVSMIFYVLIGVGIIYLQVIFSKTRNKLLGLIFPIVVFGFSILSVSALLIFSTPQNAYLLQDETIARVVSTYPMGRMLVALIIFFIFNIPTALFIGMYIPCQKQKKKMIELEKMSIQDL